MDNDDTAPALVETATSEAFNNIEELKQQQPQMQRDSATFDTLTVNGVSSQDISSAVGEINMTAAELAGSEEQHEVGNRVSTEKEGENKEEGEKEELREAKSESISKVQESGQEHLEETHPEDAEGKPAGEDNEPTTELTDEQKNTVKEPEETDHRLQCAYEQPSKIMEATPLEAVAEGSHGKENSEESKKKAMAFETAMDEHIEEDGKKNTEAKESEASKEEREGWMYILGHNKLKKKILNAGAGEHTRPVHGQWVTISYEGKLEDGTVVEKQDSQRITLGDGDVIQALDLSVALMQVSEVAAVVTDAKYAYGATGLKDLNIPPDATLTYEVTVLQAEDAPEFSSMLVNDRIKLGSEKRKRGNYYYSRGEYGSAINSYSKALEIADAPVHSQCKDPVPLQRLVDARLMCHNNLAASQLKVEAWDAAIKSCDGALTIQPTNVKALFRKGKCLASKGDTEDAIACLRKALKEDPSSKVIHDELSHLVARDKKQTESQRNMYQKMLGTDKQTNKPTEKKGLGKMWYLGGAVVAVLASASMAAYRYMHW